MIARINKRFNRLETQSAHLYMNNTGRRDDRESHFDGYLKCKLAHGQGFSIIVPDLLLFDKPSPFWIQPLFFLPNILSKFESEIRGRLNVDISCSQTLRVDFTNRDFVRRYEDGSELFRCSVTAPPDLPDYGTGEFTWEDDHRILLSLYHHTTGESKEAILGQRQFRLSHWNIQGKKRLKNTGCVYFTCLPEIVMDHDLNQIAMASDGRMLSIIDGASVPGTIPEQGVGPYTDIMVEIPVYRESTLNRRATLRLNVDAGFFSPQHILRHDPPEEQVFYEITRPFIYRLCLDPGTNWKFDDTNMRGDYSNIRHFDYIVIGRADRITGLGAPFDEEDTTFIAKIQKTEPYDNMIEFWFAEANRELFAHIQTDFIIFENTTMKSRCARCRFRNYAERKPNSLLARIWRWHAGWCPGWKAYQRELAEKGNAKTS
jgi:hypothetical protein